MLPDWSRPSPITFQSFCIFRFELLGFLLCYGCCRKTQNAHIYKLTKNLEFELSDLWRDSN